MKQINEQRVKKILRTLYHNNGVIHKDGDHYRINIESKTKLTQDLWEADDFLIPKRYDVESVSRTLLDCMTEQKILVRRGDYWKINASLKSIMENDDLGILSFS